MASSWVMGGAKRNHGSKDTMRLCILKSWVTRVSENGKLCWFHLPLPAHFKVLYGEWVYFLSYWIYSMFSSLFKCLVISLFLLTTCHSFWSVLRPPLNWLQGRSWVLTRCSHSWLAVDLEELLEVDSGRSNQHHSWRPHIRRRHRIDQSTGMAEMGISSEHCICFVRDRWEKASFTVFSVGSSLLCMCCSLS